MSRYKSIPIAAAKRIATDYAKDQVIILTYDREHNTSHVTTFGKSLLDCEQAALGGNELKRVLGWDESLCDAIPNRVQKKVDAAYEQGIVEGMRRAKDGADYKATDEHGHRWVPSRCCTECGAFEDSDAASMSCTLIRNIGQRFVKDGV